MRRSNGGGGRAESISDPCSSSESGFKLIVSKLLFLGRTQFLFDADPALSLVMALVKGHGIRIFGVQVS